MIPRIRLAVLFAFVCCLLLGAARVMVSGENCNNVKIMITNKTQWKEIKVEKLWYWDYDIKDWRQEYTWTVLWISNGETKTRTRNLERVGSQATRIKIRWGRHDSVRAFDQYEETEEFVCNDGCEVRIVIE